MRAAERSSEALLEFVLKVTHGEDRASLPASYFVPRRYWEEAAAEHPEVHAGAAGYHLRLITHYCLNLYCAACRQLALATSDRDEARQVADRHTRLLLQEEAGETRRLRAFSDDSGQWLYGDEGTRLERRAGSAYFFGAICDRLELADPLTGKTHFPPELGGSRFRWSYYNPFLGESTWATLIAPLQIAWRKWRSGGAGADELAATELRLARSILPACKAMRTGIGAVYARPAASGEKQERLVVNEANLTLYAGLLMLRELSAELGDTSEHGGLIEELLAGLLSYFRSHLFGGRRGERRLHTCGMFADRGFLPDKGAGGQPVPFAADVHTWGMSILGVAEIDSRLGHGACLELWRTVKRHAGYYPDGCADRPIAGVGYSSTPDGRPVHDVCSPEWTFGAINMCRILAAEYNAPGPHRDPGIASLFRADERSLLAGVGPFEFSPETPFACRAYPYVNRFCDTGFTWFAIPAASLCATSWAILIRQRFNPFRLGGDYLSCLYLAERKPPARDQGKEKR
jgi:hypothetical protein